mgnify:CR=1 FL=1
MVKTHEKSRIRLVSTDYMRTYDEKKYVILQIEEFEHWYVVEIVNACDYLTEDVDDLKLKLEFLEEERNRLRAEYEKLSEYDAKLEMKFERYKEFVDVLKDSTNEQPISMRLFEDLIRKYGV